MKQFDIPEGVLAIIAALRKAGHSAYLVGGCVRDLLLGAEPKDWDITTDATPEEIQKIFPESVYENSFGTVGVKTDSEDDRLKVIEVTTFRLEGKYTDKRHPDDVRFAKTVEEDLSRRDFTINAIALNLKSQSLKLKTYEFIDPYSGQLDIKERIIRAVGEPRERFGEDALRLMRAVRLAVELDFQIELATRHAIEEKAGELKIIAAERIRDEFIKIIESRHAARGVVLLEELGLLKCVLPELREGIGVRQNKHHIYTVFEHNVRALEYAAKKGYSLAVRLAALLHDVGKPQTKQGEGPDSTFYNHEMAGARLTARALDRLKFSRNFAERVTHLVRHHMFYYNVGDVSEAGVRRMLRRVGQEHLSDLMQVREADRIGSGVPKAAPYKARHLLFMIEKVKHDPISPKMLAISGDEVMKTLNIPPGPKVGYILSALLEEVLDDPRRNRKEYFEERIRALGSLSDRKLAERAGTARKKKDKIEEELEEDMKKKYYVT